MPSSLSSLDNHQVRLAARPVGLPALADWQFTEAPVAEPDDGSVVVQVQVQVQVLDPGLRGRMSAVGGGVAAFLATLRKLCSGENFGKRVLTLT